MSAQPHPLDPKRCLIVGGGGVAGIAWATGVLYGLEQVGFHLRTADRLVGTSAGSVITAQLTSPVPLERLYRRQELGTVQEVAGGLGAMGMLRLGIPFWFRKDVNAARRSIGSFAATKGSQRALARTEVICARLDGAQWDLGRDLRLPAINIETGEREVFTADGPASLAEAVEASCAVPGVWAPVTIDAKRYMDGGFPSPTNVDLAHRCTHVVVIAPLARGLRKSHSPEAELETLKRVHPGTRTVLITPDDAAQKAMGTNPLDPNARERAAKAGFAQAQHAQHDLTHVWPQRR